MQCNRKTDLARWEESDEEILYQYAKDPDIVAIVGTNLYDMGLHKSFLGAFSSNDNCYFDLNGKKVPILSLWQTSYYQGKNEPLAGYEDNRTIGKQAERCVNELKRFGLR